MRVRTRGGSLETPLVRLRNAAGRTVTLVGMVHVGDADYYLQVAGAVASLEKRGAAVQYELVRGPLPEETVSPRDRAFVDRLRAARTNGVLGDLIGLPMQGPSIEIGSGWTSPDMTMVEVLHALPDPEAFVVHNEKLSKVINELGPRSREAMGRWMRVSMRYLPVLDRALTPLRAVLRDSSPVHEVIVVQRDRRAADALLAEERDVVAMWGCGHVPGIVEHLRMSGFEVERVRWLVAVMRPSREAKARDRVERARLDMALRYGEPSVRR